MSKRSHMSRWEDLKRWFVDVGRHRYILHKIDMEPWRDQTCPICNNGFIKEPRFYYEGKPIHSECADGPAWQLWVDAMYYQRYYNENANG